MPQDENAQFFCNNFIGTPAGSIIMFGGIVAPNGWLMCDGISYLRATYKALFASIGTAYGSQNASSFNVPDLRGSVPRGVDGTAGRDPDKATRTALYTGGNAGNNIGSYQTDAIASHSHEYNGVNSSSGNNGSSYPLLSDFTNRTPSTKPVGGNETRGKNLYVNFIIKY
jgi:microcystin-dependent protein